MNLVSFGPALILRPSDGLKLAVQHDAREHLLECFPIGRYSDSGSINTIIQHQYRHYDGRLREIVPLLASRHAGSFLLSQYEEAQKILHGKHLTRKAEREAWADIEGTFRRAIKYILELMCIERPADAPALKQAHAFAAMEMAMALAEEALHLSEMSSRVHSIFPGEWTLQITPDLGDHDFELHITGPHAGFDERFRERLIRDRRSREKFVGKPQFDIHTDTHSKFLNEPFKKAFGATYAEFIAILANIITGAKPLPDEPHSLFIRLSDVQEAMTKSSRLPPQAIEVALAGFSVRPEALEEEKREAFRPKQESRAYRRGFFIFPHETGPHLAFSKSMAQECLIFIANHVCYRTLPREWKSAETRQGLNELSLAAGRWFEKTMLENLRSFGIVGSRAKRKVGLSGSTAVMIPDGVGELDFIGFSSKDDALVLVEAKMVMTGLEATFWRDDLSQFVGDENSFAVKLRKKIKWVEDHRFEIATALGFPNPRKLCVAMLTLYPCIATEVIDDFPCRSLTEFMLDYKSAGHWPYSNLD